MWVYLNGKFLLQEEAKISPLDRSVTFGDGVYEVIPSYGGELFLFEEHINRLESSLSETFIALPEEFNNLKNIIHSLYAKNKFDNQSFYLQISRGVQEIRSHQASKTLKPSLFISSQKLDENPFRENPFTAGLKTRLEEDIRWGRCDIKTTALLGNVLSMHDPSLEVVDEIIFHRGGFVNEGSKSNLFIVKDDLILTPPLSQNILQGITRNHVLRNLKKFGMKFKEENISLESLLQADEVWLTSSTKEVQPVSTIDTHKLPQIKQHDSLWKKVLDSF